MALTHSTAARTAMLAAIKTAAETAGTGPNAQIDFRTGTAPGCANAITGTALALLNLAATTFGAASTTLTMAGVPLSTAVIASGTLGYGRMLDRNAAGVEEASISTSGSDINFAGGVAVLSGGTLNISSYVLTAPN
jgi:hypothetical protein